MLDHEQYFKNLVVEINNGNDENWDDFFNFSCELYRQYPDVYDSVILQCYCFSDSKRNEALVWLKTMLEKHTFSNYFLSYCIDNDLLTATIHWQWKYVQGISGNIPADSTLILLEGHDQLLVWLEYDEDPKIQPLAAFAELSYNDLSFKHTYRSEQYLIYTLSGYDELSERDMDIEVRVYNEKSRDKDGDPIYSDIKAVTMADSFTQQFHIIKERHPEDNTFLTADEIDDLLKL